MECSTSNAAVTWSPSSHSTSMSRIASMDGSASRSAGSRVRQPSPRRPSATARFRSFAAIHTSKPQRPAEVAQPALHLGMGGVVGVGRRQTSGAVVAQPADVVLPTAVGSLVVRQRRWHVPTAADVEEKPGDRSEVVVEVRPVRRVEREHTCSHGEVVVPPPEPDLRSGERVVPLDDGGVRGRHHGGMQEVRGLATAGPRPLMPAAANESTAARTAPSPPAQQQASSALPNVRWLASSS